MRITRMEVLPERENRGLVARFDVQVNEQIALKVMHLSRNREGQFRVFPPNVRGANAAWISPELAERITAAARAEYHTITGGQLPHGRVNQAA